MVTPEKNTFLDQFIVRRPLSSSKSGDHYRHPQLGDLLHKTHLKGL